MFLNRSKWTLAALSILSFFLLVVGRLAYLQLVKGEDYLRFSDSYTLKEIPIRAPRGNFYDRKGRVLASTRPAFSLFIHLAKVKDLKTLLEELSGVLETTPERLRDEIAASRDLPHFRPIPLATDLRGDQVAKLKMKKSVRLAGAGSGSDDFAALEIEVEPLRKYEEGEIFSHVFGYLREISEEKLKEMNKTRPGRYRPGDVVGVQGLERRFDESLRGRDGFEEVIVDALGREVKEDRFGLRKELLYTPPRPGDHLYLTLDQDLQKSAYEALEGHEGAVVVLGVDTGELLALVSHPGYDPNRLVANVSKDYWRLLNTDERKFLLNRTVQAAYPPGSTFKILLAIAALAEGVVKPDEKISCPGYYQFGGRRFGCWLGRGHGAVDFHRALVQSCDVYFYKVGERLGIDRIAKYSRLFGLGENTGIELDFERSGLIPSTEWKKRVKKEDWNPSETLSAAIGQGFDLVTPLQNALMMARVANGGSEIHPHLVSEIEHPDGSREKVGDTSAKKIEVSLGEKNWEALAQALKGVVHEPSGTAHRIALPGITMGGKTGTAQVVGYDVYGRKARSKKTEDHAWFIAFAPVEKPEIAVAVVVEHGGHGGSTAAPIAREVIKKYFELYHDYGKVSPPTKQETAGSDSSRPAKTERKHHAFRKVTGPRF